MGNVSTDQLKRVIESQHGGTAELSRSLRVAVPKGQQADWDGVVHVFDLNNHPRAKRAYAWSSSIKGGMSPRYFAVLHMGRVTGPIEAVMAAASAIRGALRQAVKA